MNPARSSLAIVLATLTLTACATRPERIDVFERARATAALFLADPMAERFASIEAQQTRSALTRAERAVNEGAELGRIEHLSHLALRNAQTGLARIQEGEARARISQAEADRTAVLLAQRTREAEAAKARAEAARIAAEANARSANMAREQLAELQETIDSTQAKQTERGVILTLGDVLFDTDEATLEPAAVRMAGRLAEFLRDNPQTRVIIEGYADSRGSVEYNEQLSRRRAQSVADELRIRGITADRFRIIGRGEALPLATNATPAGRQENRRVEVVFSDDAGRFATTADTALR